MYDHHYTSRQKWEPNHYVDDVLAFRNIVKVVECYGFIRETLKSVRLVQPADVINAPVRSSNKVSVPLVNISDSAHQIFQKHPHTAHTGHVSVAAWRQLRNAAIRDDLMAARNAIRQTRLP